jgi:lipopolysaccharide export system ATP-binding protein
MQKISTVNLVKSYSGKKAVDGVSIEVSQGEVVGLLGPNGAGKTTTFYMIVGLIRPDAGQVFLDNRNISLLPMHRRAQAGIGYLPQEPSIFRKLTVEENILILWEQRPEIPRSEYQTRLAEILKEFGLHQLRKNRGWQLSGGERRRLEIARAIALNPAFILLDEPFTGVDPIAIDTIQETIKVLKKKNLGLLITDHNVRDTLSITDRAYILHQGKILTSGPSAVVAENPEARRFYLGEDFDLPVNQKNSRAGR